MSVLDPVNKSYWLAHLCEANYRKLNRLIPSLASISAAAAQAEGKPALLVRLIERSPYTLTMELTHSFERGYEALREPALRIRVYLDAGAAEVLSDRERPDVQQALPTYPDIQGVMDYKWCLNYFLSQWLDHCLQSRYCFTPSHPDEEVAIPVTC